MPLKVLKSGSSLLRLARVAWLVALLLAFPVARANYFLICFDEDEIGDVPMLLLAAGAPYGFDPAQVEGLEFGVLSEFQRGGHTYAMYPFQGDDFDPRVVMKALMDAAPHSVLVPDHLWPRVVDLGLYSHGLGPVRGALQPRARLYWLLPRITTFRAVPYRIVPPGPLEHHELRQLGRGVMPISHFWFTQVPRQRLVARSIGAGSGGVYPLVTEIISFLGLVEIEAISAQRDGVHVLLDELSAAASRAARPAGARSAAQVQIPALPSSVPAALVPQALASVSSPISNSSRSNSSSSGPSSPWDLWRFVVPHRGGQGCGRSDGPPS